mmetsp:Transcript_16083/g.27157  ORF Transcript_16083/g.27157 Transcript_16083/m.27157 type:complete len:181 (+) Transcript_16083:315-857(+)
MNLGLPKFSQMSRPSNQNLNEFVKQYTRLTVVLETVSYVHNFVNLSGSQNPKTHIVNSYDLLALRVKQIFRKNQKQNASQLESLFEQVCVKTDCDIVSVDCGERSPFFFQKSHIKQALARGAVIELNYGQALLENGHRKTFINTAMQLTKLSKGGKGLIMASETNRRIFMRSTTDLVKIA